MSWLRRVFGIQRQPRRGDTLEKSDATTVEERAVRAAADAARAKGLHWEEPILAEYRYSPEGNYWLIQSNRFGRDHRILVTVDDETGGVSKVQSHGRTGVIDHGR